jgi:phytoene/squalene synthetase
MNTADDILAQTSRTFYIPISQLPSGLHEAVMSAYLCMRAIDEIEDDPALKPELKANLLTEVSEIITRDNYEEELKQLFEPHKHELKDFCMIPLMLALATLDTISQGKEKLSRSDVKEIVSEITGE